MGNEAVTPYEANIESGIRVLFIKALLRRAGAVGREVEDAAIILQAPTEELLRKVIELDAPLREVADEWALNVMAGGKMTSAGMTIIGQITGRAMGLYEVEKAGRIS